MHYLLQEDDWFMKEADVSKDEFSESVLELNKMVGLTSLKQNMTTLFNRSRFEQKRRDMGFPVLESLLTVLSQKNPDMIVILTGYEKEMNQMRR